MRTLNIEISDLEYEKFGIKTEQPTSQLGVLTDRERQVVATLLQNAPQLTGDVLPKPMQNTPPNIGTA